eukprot:TRINITY_DN659_c0_g1_i1.p1 TRINITY_DN659_c0_g1~~TRINITY_DN659_c0_g1_i1.p1  ORF type:complete len:202 (-),score=45.91 TRINITY_DN659_c0_g1_i1:29-544(-)
MEAAAEGQASPFYAQQLLAYLLLQQGQEARFLWQRMPASARQQPELQAIWQIAKALLSRNFGQAQAAASGFAWTAGVAPLVELLRVAIQRSATAAVGDAYAAVDVATLGALLGLPREAALTLATQNGWAVEQDGQTVRPHKLSGRSGAVDPELLDRISRAVIGLQQTTALV